MAMAVMVAVAVEEMSVVRPGEDVVADGDGTESANNS